MKDYTIFSQKLHPWLKFGVILGPEPHFPTNYAQCLNTGRLVPHCVTIIAVLSDFFSIHSILLQPLIQRNISLDMSCVIRDRSPSFIFSHHFQRSSLYNSTYMCVLQTISNTIQQKNIFNFSPGTDQKVLQKNVIPSSSSRYVCQQY